MAGVQKFYATRPVLNKRKLVGFLLRYWNLVEFEKGTMRISHPPKFAKTSEIVNRRYDFGKLWHVQF